MSNNCLQAKKVMFLLLIKNNLQKQPFCQSKMADLKACSNGVRKANYIIIHDNEGLSKPICLHLQTGAFSDDCAAAYTLFIYRAPCHCYILQPGTRSLPGLRHKILFHVFPSLLSRYLSYSISKPLVRLHK